MFPRICFRGSSWFAVRPKQRQLELVAVEGNKTTKLKLRVYNQAKRGYDMIWYGMVWYDKI